MKSVETSKNMKTNHILSSLSALGLLMAALVLGTPAQASFIQGVTIQAVSSQYTNLLTSNPDRRDVTNLVSSTGLWGDMGSIIPQGSEWLSAAGTTPTAQYVTFDLGAVHQVDGIKIWNFSQAGAGNLQNCVKGLQISYSTTGAEPFTTNYPGGQSLVQAPGTFSAFAQLITTNVGFSARYIRFNVLSNYTATGLTGTVGLSKVRFIDNSVPLAVVSATQNYSRNQITVLFGESVDSASATNAANYVIQTSGTNSATVLSAAMGQFNDRVILKTSPLTNSSYSVAVKSVYDLALTTPANTTNTVSPELIVWLKSDTGVTTDESGNVTQWQDQSGYGHHAVTATVNQYSAPPTLFPSALNGLPVVNFNGTQLLKIPHDPTLAINGDMTVTLVLSSSSSQIGDPISKTGGHGLPYGTPLHSGYDYNMPGPFDIQIAKTTGKPSIVWGNEGAGNGYGSLTATYGLVDQYYVVSYVVRGTNISCYLNGSFNGASAPATVGVRDAGNPIMLGVRADSGSGTNATGGILNNGAQFMGNLAEAMVIRGTITPTDLNSIHTYLGSKWGIQIVPMEIREQPQSVTTQAGKTATFWVNAVGVQPVAYQWKTNGVNVPGATSAVYTTPALTVAGYNGLNYTVTITTGVGVTNSAAAKLTVVNDTSAPTLASAVKTGTLTNLVVKFSEAIDSGTALNPANYSLNNGASVASARLGTGAGDNVILTTSALDAGASYYLTVQHVADLFGNAMTSATSPVLPAELSLFLKGDSGVTLDTTNNLVVQWADQTTNGNNAVQFIGGPVARPGLDGAINSVPAVRFTSDNKNYLQAASSPSLALTSDLSIYVVANIADLNAPREFIGKTAGSNPAPYDYYVRPDRSQTLLYRGNGTVNAAVAGRLPSAGVPHVFSVRMAGTTVNHYLDGLDNGSGSLSTTIGDSGAPLVVGSRSALDQFMNGEVAEVMIFGAALSAADGIAVDNYLGAKYFPFSIPQQPADVVTTEGLTATFSVVASQGSAHFRYQWQVNSMDIPSATNASYTTPPLSTGNSGDHYAVVIVLPGISTNTSSTATLTVGSDSVPPTVSSVGKPIWSQTNLVVVFSEAVNPTTALSAANYTLDNGASVLSAVIGETPNKVVLTTTPLVAGVAYTLTVKNVQDNFNNTMVAADVPSGVYPSSVALWLSADTGVVADESGFVSQWADQSGNNNNLVAGNAPLLVNNVLNGKPVLRFDGTSSYMYAGSSPSLAITSDMAIFAVVNFDSLTASGSRGMIVSKTSLNLPAPFDYYVRSSAVQFYRGNGSVSSLSAAAAVPSTGIPHLLGVVMQGTTVSHRLDGKPNGGGTLSTTIADVDSPLFIGSRQDNVNHLQGDMAELIVLNASVSADEMAAIENYFGSKYNMVIGSVPSLSISKLGSALVLYWPTPTANFTLQAAPDLSGTGWASVTNTVSSANGTSSVTVTPSGNAQFFRLQKP